MTTLGGIWDKWASQDLNYRFALCKWQNEF